VILGEELKSKSTASLSVPYNITVENNIFINFSNCGSVLSNHFGYLSGASFNNLPFPDKLTPLRILQMEFPDPYFSINNFFPEMSRVK
jgi:hypothetical protein